jgi:hypothetical protein
MRMKVRLVCLACESDEEPPVVAELRDDGRYDLTCTNGHKTLAALSNPRFELLADSAALALCDGYFREAVVSFTAALEDFWGFYVRAVALKFGAPFETLDRLRRDVKLSERRLGAMHLAHLLLTNTRYEGDDGKMNVGSQKRREFRNTVVHDGRFATEAEALDYGQYVYEAVIDGLEELRQHAAGTIEAQVSNEASGQLSRQASEAAPGSTDALQLHQIETLISHAVGSRTSFADALDAWGKRNEWGHARSAQGLTGKLPS